MMVGCVEAVMVWRGIHFVTFQHMYLDFLISSLVVHVVERLPLPL